MRFGYSLSGLSAARADSPAGGSVREATRREEASHLFSKGRAISRICLPYCGETGTNFFHADS